MYKRVDVVPVDDVVEGYSYFSEGGGIEQVRIYDKSIVQIQTDDEACSLDIYTNDIPNLVKALEAAYKYNTGGSNV